MRKTGQQLVKEFRHLWAKHPEVVRRETSWGEILRKADWQYQHRKDIERFKNALTGTGTRKAYRSLPKPSETNQGK